MGEADVPATTLRDRAELLFWQSRAGGLLPPRWFLRDIPPVARRAARRGMLRVEIVSHCWRYSHLLAYQLSSLVLYPPTRLSVKMTVLHAAEDAATVSLLQDFGARAVPNVSWNWRTLPPGQLFRRGIGRNLAALQTDCDWIWFTDCDLLFGSGCLDALADALQGRQDALVYPAGEYCTGLLAAGDPVLERGRTGPMPVRIDPALFMRHPRTRATGPLQITHGDVARACGYCRDLRVFQTPARAWTKATEDRVFRWLLRTQGVPIEVPGVLRIRHAGKGRYGGGGLAGRVRGAIRQVQSRLRDPRAAGRS